MHWTLIRCQIQIRLRNTERPCYLVILGLHTQRSFMLYVVLVSRHSLVRNFVVSKLSTSRKQMSASFWSAEYPLAGPQVRRHTDYP